MIPFRSIQEKIQGDKNNTTTRARTHEGPADPEPFEPTNDGPLRGMPNPPGSGSPEADRLAAMFAGTETPNQPRMDYGEAARLLCGDYAAEWVEVLLTCHRKLWCKTPGYPRLAQTLREWQAEGRVDPRFAEAFRPTPRPRGPARPSPAPAYDPVDQIMAALEGLD